jgi:hypothetical protein
VVLVLALIVALVAAQRYLTRRTNRLINVGLLVATCAVIVGLIWGTVALWIESARVANGHDHGTSQVEIVVQARITALTLRANETLTLVARGDGGEYEAEFQELAGQLTGDGDSNLLVRAQALAETQEARNVLEQARMNAADWLEAHGRVRQLDDGGSYQDAVSLAIGDDPEGAATMFNRLDDNLLQALNHGREEFVDETSAASRMLTGLVPGVALLALLAAVGVTMGIRDRLQEYR